MSRDPLEELFGPLEIEPEESATAPQPMPARTRLAQEQAERVRTAQLPARDADRASKRRAAVVPWIVVGAVAVVALVISIVLVGNARAGDDAADPAPAAPTTTQEPAPADTEEPAPEETEEPEDDGPPDVQVGDTMTMNIEAWGATSELSQRFGSTSYAIPDNVNLVLTSDLLNSFPDACADMRQGWGAIREDDGSYAVLKPDATCDAAPELYDEVWGLVAAWVDTIS